MRSGWPVAFGIVALVSAPVRAQEAPGGAGAVAADVPTLNGKPCGLFEPGAKEAASSTCLACHSASGGASPREGSHPVGSDYASVRMRRPSDFRPSAEVARRGIGVPNGKVECVTCHDSASPWAARVVLPIGAPVIVRSDPGAPGADENPTNWRTADPQRPPPPPGSSVVSAPLCAACHTLAD